MRYLLALLATTAMAAGAGSGGTYQERSDYKEVWKEEGFSDKCDVNIKKTTKVSGVLDGKGKTYCWKGAGYPNKCHAKEEISENEPRMFEMERGSTIKNMKVICTLDGFKMNDNTKIENVVFLDAEEDAITTLGNGNIIRNNKFYLCQDKCIQMNKATKVTIEGNYFKHALRAMSGSGANSGGATGIIARNNKCKNCELMIRAQRNHEMRAIGNSIDGGEALFESVEKSKVCDGGGNVATGGAKLISKDSTNEIKECR